MGGKFFGMLDGMFKKISDGLHERRKKRGFEKLRKKISGKKRDRKSGKQKRSIWQKMKIRAYAIKKKIARKISNSFIGRTWRKVKTVGKKVFRAVGIGVMAVGRAVNRVWRATKSVAKGFLKASYLVGRGIGALLGFGARKAKTAFTGKDERKLKNTRFGRF